jgi:hypothetical protein
LDVGFDDVVHPGAESLEIPTLLDFVAPSLLCYSRESTIAEKFEAMIKLGAINSRMKDFFDIWLMARQFDFSDHVLSEAIRLTFEKRGTHIPTEISAFGTDFIKEKQTQWTAFRKRLGEDWVPSDFREVVAAIEAFLAPVISSPTTGTASLRKWSAGSWR